MFVINVPYFDLDQIYMLYGRQLNWIQVFKKNYIVIHKDKALGISQQGPGYYNNSRDRLCMHCTDDDVYDVWFKYFDFVTDYQALYKNNESLGKTKFQASGLHIIHRDREEALICAFLSFYNEYFDCRTFCRAYGTKETKHKNSFRNLGAHEWYEFPKLDKLYEIFERDKRVCEFLDWIYELVELDEKSDKELFMSLQDFGFEKRLIQWLILFGYERFCVFPMDEYLDTYLKEEYDFLRKDLKGKKDKGYLWMLAEFEMIYPNYDPVRYNLWLGQLKENKIEKRDFDNEFGR